MDEALLNFPGGAQESRCGVSDEGEASEGEAGAVDEVEVDWAAETAGCTSLPRLRELLQTAERRTSARIAPRPAFDADTTAAASRLAALDAADVREAAASGCLCTLLTAAERAEARLARRRAAGDAAREASEAAAEAAALMAEAEALAAAVSSDGSESDTRPCDN